MEPTQCYRCRYNTNRRKCAECLFGDKLYSEQEKDTVVSRLVNEVLNCNLDAYVTLGETHFEPVFQAKPWLRIRMNDAARKLIAAREPQWCDMPLPADLPQQPNYVAPMQLPISYPAQVQTPMNQGYTTNPVSPQQMLQYPQYQPYQYQPAQYAQYQQQADAAFHQPQYQYYRQQNEQAPSSASSPGTSDSWLHERGYHGNTAQQQYPSRAASQQRKVEPQPSMSRVQPDARVGLSKQVGSLSIDESNTSIKEPSSTDSSRSVFGARHRIEYTLEPSDNHSHSGKNIVVAGRDLSMYDTKKSAALQNRGRQRGNQSNIRSASYQQRNEPNKSQDTNQPAESQQPPPRESNSRDNRGNRRPRQPIIDPNRILRDVTQYTSDLGIYIHKLATVADIAKTNAPEMLYLKKMIYNAVALLEKTGLRDRMMEFDYSTVDLSRSLEIITYAPARRNNLRTVLDKKQLYMPITAVDIEIISQFKIYGDPITEKFLMQFILPQADPAKFFFFCKVAHFLNQELNERNIDWESIPYNTGPKFAAMSIAAALLGSHSAHKSIYQSKERAEYSQLKDLIELLGKPLTEQQEAQVLKDTLAAAGHVEMDTDEADRFYDDVNIRMKRYGDRKTQFDKGQLYKKRPLPDSPDAPTGSKTVQPESKFRNTRKNQSGELTTPQLGVMGGKQPVKPTPPVAKPIIIPVVKPNLPLAKFGSAPSLLDTTTVKSTGTSTEPNRNKNNLRSSNTNNGNNKAANKTGVAGKSQQLPAVPAPVPPISTVPVEQQQISVAQPTSVEVPSVPVEEQSASTAMPPQVNTVLVYPPTRETFEEKELAKLPLSRMNKTEREFYVTTQSYQDHAEPSSNEYVENMLVELRKKSLRQMTDPEYMFFIRYENPERLPAWTGRSPEKPIAPQGDDADVFHETVEELPVRPAFSEVLGEALNAVAAAESVPDTAGADADVDMLPDAGADKAAE
ncbi:uncharacterized protein LOC129584299 isoform X2 [Paramacrobiotus metropolitanus]|uniref:uncharacterized protein LOC129584299 isoform X2 n=1 Tax=Paramacrobiotus metropolitanus TaxID=2943436 RepID=UPI00244587DF|nr:uncharacterized protein LOC129584299 isoform X2 [Paramacrobiotus metropolitanus]